MAKKKINSSKENGWKNFLSFFKNRNNQKVFGFLFILFALYFFISFTSFFYCLYEYNGDEDMSEVFEVKDMKVAIEICEAGIDQQYLVYVNGNKYKAMNTFGKTINLNK